MRSVGYLGSGDFCSIQGNGNGNGNADYLGGLCNVHVKHKQYKIIRYLVIIHCIRFLSFVGNVLKFYLMNMSGEKVVAISTSILNRDVVYGSE